MARGFHITNMKDVENWSPAAREAVRKALGVNDGDSTPPPRSGYRKLSQGEKSDQLAMLDETKRKLAPAPRKRPPPVKQWVAWLARLIFNLRRRGGFVVVQPKSLMQRVYGMRLNVKLRSETFYGVFFCTGCVRQFRTATGLETWKDDEKNFRFCKDCAEHIIREAGSVSTKFAD